MSLEGLSQFLGIQKTNRERQADGARKNAAHHTPLSRLKSASAFQAPDSFGRSTQTELAARRNVSFKNQGRQNPLIDLDPDAPATRSELRNINRYLDASSRIG